MSSSAAPADVRSQGAVRPALSMTSRRDQLALVRFAVQARDWRLVELLAQLLARESPGWLGVAHRAYATLSARLRLDGDSF